MVCNMEPKKGRHSVHLLHVHLVFVSKRRAKIFNSQHLQWLQIEFGRICEDYEADLEEFNGEADHVHLLVTYPPKVRLSELVNTLKGASSRRIKLAFPALNNFWSVRKSAGALWSPSYFAGSVGGAPLSVLRSYIENQDRPD
jgi:putative transposase